MASYYDIENGLIELTMEKQDKQGDAGGKAAVLAVLCGKEAMENVFLQSLGYPSVAVSSRTVRRVTKRSSLPVPII